jgi:hypothetical protein
LLAQPSVVCFVGCGVGRCVMFRIVFLKSRPHFATGVLQSWAQRAWGKLFGRSSYQRLSACSLSNCYYLIFHYKVRSSRGGGPKELGLHHRTKIWWRKPTLQSGLRSGGPRKPWCQKKRHRPSQRHERKRDRRERKTTNRKTEGGPRRNRNHSRRGEPRRSNPKQRRSTNPRQRQRNLERNQQQNRKRNQHHNRSRKRQPGKFRRRKRSLLRD